MMPERTKDARFLRHKLSTGEAELYSMYGRNIRVEGDGIAYNELNLLRALFLEPILYVLMGSNLLLAYTNSPSSDRMNHSAYKLALLFAHVLGFIFNLLRYVIASTIFIVELVAWPIRVFFGLIFTPVGILISAAHIYGLPCNVIHTLLLGAGPAVVRRVRIKQIHSHPKTFNAGGLGQILCYETNNIKDASYIGYTFKLKQRCGIGPECVWVRGRRVFVSNWSPISITSFFGGKAEWKLMDLSNYEWRKTIFEFAEGFPEDVDEEAGISTHASRDTSRDASRDAGLWAIVKSYEELGTLSFLADLELYYNSPLGWNKYHLMRAHGEKIVVKRNDRRALSHVLATVSSLLIYLQFRDGSKGWLGISVEHYALVIANYALVTGYAAEILVGKATEVVDAKSDRYGVIVTRAIDRGYVRGFRVPNGEWLRYENGDESLPTHRVVGNEVNVTCNSYVFQAEKGRMMVNVMCYHRHPPSFPVPWEGDVR